METIAWQEASELMENVLIPIVIKISKGDSVTLLKMTEPA